MTDDKVIEAARNVVQRRDVRGLFRDHVAVTLNGKAPGGGNVAIPLDQHTTRAVLNAIDAILSDRLAKLGVCEA